MQSSSPKEMTFADHLEELRWHILRSVIAVLAIGLMAFFYMDVIFQEVILGPVKANFWTYRMLCKISEATCFTEFEFHLQNRTMAGQFSMHFMASIITGVV